ncbi:hypothetical protein [Streptomyces sp. NPDC088785]|uniref:hypothetical protein n=1 Tax=Streptomyces sp. NPDC088785 TaxID=3365897 RepID=UPI003822D679
MTHRTKTQAREQSAGPPEVEPEPDPTQGRGELRKKLAGPPDDEPDPDPTQGRGELRDQPPPDGESETKRGRVRAGARLQLIAMAVAAVLLVATGATLFTLAHHLRTEPATRNHALTDADATNRVNGEVSSALAKIFSYSPDGIEATRRTAAQVLSGKAAAQYAQLFTQVQKNAPSQKVTLTTDAVRVGTADLHGDTAHLLVFLDQSTRRGDRKAVTSAAQLSVTARLRNDVWQIVDIKAR